MSQVLAQPLAVSVVSSVIRVELGPAVTTTEVQPLGRAVAGASQTVIIKPA